MLDQATATERLAEVFAGELVDPGHSDYDTHRAVYNGMIDRRPALIARARGTADVIAAVNYAREEGLAVAVRSGGHNIAGNAVGDDALMLDLTQMRGVRVDPRARTARTAGGTLWGEFDHETQAFGLATPGGRVTTTGVAGFTLGGGYAWLSPKYGLTIDNLISADVVTADGELVTASETENEELFWGLRGGGGNFGVVTSFEFRLHPVGPIVMGGLLGWPIAEAPHLIRKWRDFMDAAPDELASAVVQLPMAPPEDFVPPEAQGQPAIGMAFIYAGDPDEGLELVRPFREADPAFDLLGPMPYAAFQAMLDPFAPHGVRNYWRGDHLAELSDGAIDAYTSNPPTGLDLPSQMILFRHAGAVKRVPDEATAFSHRDADYMFHPIAAWPDPSRDDAHIEWVRRSSKAMEPYGTGGVYLNFISDDDKVRAGFSPQKWERLVALKDRYDPTNMFRFNQNVPPSGA
jgi:FAD/FMN-containing dehydrogenase